jgi:hypothetical protein
MAECLPASNAANCCNSLIFWAVAPLCPPAASARLLSLTPARRLQGWPPLRLAAGDLTTVRVPNPLTLPPGPEAWSGWKISHGEVPAGAGSVTEKCPISKSLTSPGSRKSLSGSDWDWRRTCEKEIE